MMPRRQRIDVQVQAHAAHLTGTMLSAIMLAGLHLIGPTAAFMGCHDLRRLAPGSPPSPRARCCQSTHRTNGSIAGQIIVSPGLFATEERHFIARASLANDDHCSGSDSSGNGNSNAKSLQLIGSDEEWKEYYETADSVLSEAKTFGRKDSEEDKLAVREYLLLREGIVPIHLPTLISKADGEPRLETAATNDAVGSSLHSELEEQRLFFCEVSGLSSAQQKLTLRVLGYIGNYCAKKRSCVPLRIGWYKLKEMGASPRENVLSTYLYGLALAEEEIQEISMRKKVSISLPEEVAAFHDSLFQPTEKTLTLRIKALVQKGDAMGAEQLLEMMPVSRRGFHETSLLVRHKIYFPLLTYSYNFMPYLSILKSNKDGGKLRSYLPILELYCEKGAIGSALGLYKRMRRASGVHFNAENYSLLISAIAERGYFRDNSPPIYGAADIGYHPAMGPQLLSTLVEEMADDVLEITASCASRMRSAFIKGFGLDLDDENIKEEFIEDASARTKEMPRLPGDLVVDRVCVDDKAALCSRTNATLRLIALDKAQRSQLHDTLEEMANSQYAEYDEKLKQRNQIVEKNDEGYAAKQLRNFAEWIE